MYSYSVNTKEIQILSGMLGEIVGKFSFVEFGTVGPPEVQQFSRPKHPSLVQVWFSRGSLAKLCAKSLAIVLAIVFYRERP